MLLLMLSGAPAPYDFTELVASPAPNSRYVNGVLGFTRNCGFAVYPDRQSALVRDQNHAYLLKDDWSTGKFDKRETTGAFVNQYVDMAGKIVDGPAGFAGTFLVKTFSIASYESRFAYASTAKCMPFDAEPVGVQEAARMASAHQGHVLVYGYIREAEEFHIGAGKADRARGAKDHLSYFNLYATREAYDDKVSVQFLKTSLRNLPGDCEGRLVLLDGDLGWHGINDRYFAYVENATVVADTCPPHKASTNDSSGVM